MNKTDEDLKKIHSELKADRWLAHQFLFKKRHPLAAAEFHPTMARAFSGPDPRVVFQTFRDGAKSTHGEEAVTIGAEYMEFKNCLIVGASFDRAVDRLRSIKNEIANNEIAEKIFGNQVGGTWAESKVVLKNGVCIQAFGREQSLRGVKHLDIRPDFIWIDDLEDDETTRDLAAIKKVMKWLMGVLMPACQKTARFRVTGSSLHPRAVICQLAEDPEWTSYVWPIEYLGPAGRVASWPAKFSLADIDKIKGRFSRMGTLKEFNQEYMCKAEDEESKPFKHEMIRIEPVARSWHGVYGMYDPARTVNIQTSAQTGKAVWSWIGNRLIIWKASGHFWRPDEIVDDIFKTNHEFHPVKIGVEKDGLEEFIEQPIRQAQVKRGILLPYEGLKAPPGKIDFIKSLQPLFISGDAIMAERLPELEAQMLSFPSGRMDILNALAYAPRMRPGFPVYEDFGDRHVFANLMPFQGRPYRLCLHAQDGIAAGVLCQLEQGCLRVFADWIDEGDMAECLKRIITSAALEADSNVKIVGHPKALEKYSNTGMRMAVTQTNNQITVGADPMKGRSQIIPMLRNTRANGMPEIAVSEQATWTLRGFAGGYALEDGLAVKGIYRVLMESLESLTGILKGNIANQEDDERYYSTDRHGRRYLSAMRTGNA